jgi:hypothetical protein
MSLGRGLAQVAMVGDFVTNYLHFEVASILPSCYISYTQYVLVADYENCSEEFLNLFP